MATAAAHCVAILTDGGGHTLSPASATNGRVLNTSSGILLNDDDCVSYVRNV